MKFFKKIKEPAFWGRLLPLIIIIAGSWLRFYNLSWDEGFYFHPDERNIAMAVSRIDFFDRLDPEFFAYGSLPIYLYRAAGEAVSRVTGKQDWVSSWASINLIGRHFSAFFSSLTIGMVFFLAKRLWNQKVATLSAFFVAFCPSLIQAAHFSVTESLITFWIIFLGLLSLRFFKKPSFLNYGLAGIVLGLAVATKISALSFLSLIAVSHFLGHPEYHRPLSTFLKKSGRHHLKFLLLILLAFSVFSIASPYVYLSWPKFTESIAYEGGVVSGRLKVVYVYQFEKTVAYFFQIKNLIWQMGLTATAGLAGLACLLALAIKNKNKLFLIFLSFPLAYFAYVGSWYTKFIRYMVPVLPFLAIAAAWLLFTIRQRWKNLGVALIFGFSLASFLWTIAFSSIYARPSTRIVASNWIYQNVACSSKILTEHWDDGLPVHLPDHYCRYQSEPLAIYDPDNQAKAPYLAAKLSQADYIFIASRRLWGTLINWPEKYPITSRYYRLLFNQELGFQKVAEFTSYPSLPGLEIRTDPSEETFQVYDHPRIIIFKNIDRLTFGAIKSKLQQDNY